MEVKEGISPVLDNNGWFQDKVKPNVKKAKYIEADDNFIYQIVRTENPTTGRVAVLLLKVTQTGFIKSTMNMAPGLAKEIADIIKEMAE